MAKHINETFGLTEDDLRAAGEGLRLVLKRGNMVSMTAIGLIVRLEEMQLKREEFEDKKMRLDAGRPTEIIRSDDDIGERIERLRKRVYPAEPLAVESKGASHAIDGNADGDCIATLDGPDAKREVDAGQEASGSGGVVQADGGGLGDEPGFDSPPWGEVAGNLE